MSDKKPINHQKAKIQSNKGLKKKERVIGLEPTAFSLGS